MFRDAHLRLTLMYAAASVLLFGLLAVGIYTVLVQSLDDDIDADIRHVLAEGIDLVTVDPEGDDLALPTAFGPVFLFAFSPEGNVIRNPRDLPAYQMVPGVAVRTVATTREGAQLTREAGGERFRLHLEPVIQDGEAVAVLVAGRSLARRDADVRLFTRTLAGSVAVWAVLVSAIAYVLAARALQPVRQAYARQEAFVAGAAHELRSPIAVIRAASDVGLRSDPSSEVRALLGEINAVAADASTLVDTLLDLARMRPEAAEEGGASDLAEVVGRELTRMELLLREHNTRVVDDLASVLVAVPAAEIGRITRALLENVIAHTPRGTSMVVRTRQAGQVGELSVEDNGPGVAPEDLDAVFEPFARGDEARSRDRRVGMGLAIVQTVAEHYGGSVRARMPERGRGLVIEVQFPVV